ncbi:hypothetical protein HanIR_Chr16g0834651 [Helianthus annuus]|nr:hypothetical protein HanIR_Chr16g0834651 [Helianthus annuus]
MVCGGSGWILVVRSGRRDDIIGEFRERDLEREREIKMERNFNQSIHEDYVLYFIYLLFFSFFTKYYFFNGELIPWEWE